MYGGKINFIQNGKKNSTDIELCNIFNVFFSNIISELKYHCFLSHMVLKAFENHPSIKNIKSKKLNSTFAFKNNYTDVVTKVSTT